MYLSFMHKRAKNVNESKLKRFPWLLFQAGLTHTGPKKIENPRKLIAKDSKVQLFLWRFQMKFVPALQGKS